MANIGKCEMEEADKCYQISVLAISTQKLGQPAQKAPYTLPLSHSHGDRWSATNPATLSLHLILFSTSLSVAKLSTQGYYFPNASFVGPFFSLLALFLVKLSW